MLRAPSLTVYLWRPNSNRVQMRDFHLSSPEVPQEGPSSKRVALRIALSYCIVGFLWIMFSSALSAKLSPNKEVLTFVQSLKGWPFVGVASLRWHPVFTRPLHRVSQLNGTCTNQHHQPYRPKLTNH